MTNPETHFFDRPRSYGILERRPGHSSLRFGVSSSPGSGGVLPSAVWSWIISVSVSRAKSTGTPRVYYSDSVTDPTTERPFCGAVRSAPNSGLIGTSYFQPARL